MVDDADNAMSSAETFSTIKLHQAIHGYDRGHRLLASSQTLSPASERIMRLRSDYTGSSQMSGFSTYLSAYPIEEDKCVAFARTWYADEMRRPGCVWTHTLFVPFEVIETLSNLESLNKAFRRPESSRFFEYEHPASVSQDLVDLQLTHQLEDVANVIVALYASPDLPIFIRSRSSTEFEQLILSIWSQQWPALRRRFTFCTGLLELRDEDSLCDVQVIPYEDTKLFRQSSEAGVVVEFARKAIKLESTHFSIAAKDLLYHRSDFRVFLRRYGSEEFISRGAYEKLLRVYSTLAATQPDPKATGECVARLFPGSGEALELKQKLFGGLEKREFYSSVPEIALLTLIADTDSAAFDPSSLDFSSRFQIAFQDDVSNAMALLESVLKAPKHILYDYLIESAAECMDASRIGTVAKWNWGAALRMIKRNVELASSVDLWTCHECAIDSFASEFLQELNRSSQVGSQILKAQILADRTDQVGPMEVLLGDSIISALLNAGTAVTVKVDRECRLEWHSVLIKYQDAALQWLATRNGCADECDVFSGQCLTIGVKETANRIIGVWTRLGKDVENLSSQTILHSKCVIFAAALEDGGSEAENCFRTAFPIIYQAAEADQLVQNDWAPLRSMLPNVGHEWDKCSRLRAGLIEYCVNHTWSVDTVVECTQRGEMLDEIFSSWWWDRRIKAFLKDVAIRIQGCKHIATSSQASAARRFLASLWF